MVDTRFVVLAMWALMWAMPPRAARAGGRRRRGEDGGLLSTPGRRRKNVAFGIDFKIEGSSNTNPPFIPEMKGFVLALLLAPAGEDYCTSSIRL